MKIERIDILRKRAEIIQLIRSFFIQSGYLEVDTPILSPFLIPESTIEVFKTEYSLPDAEPTELYLIPSPELWMKRLLALGVGNMFQITRSFRNHEPLSSLHQPEFTMLEWYTEDANYIDSISVLEALFSFLFQKLKTPPAFLHKKIQIDCSSPFERISMQEAFQRFLKLNLEQLMSIQSITRAAESHNIEVTPQDGWGDIFNKLFLTFVEPDLPAGRPLILYDYPSAIPTMAKEKKQSPWAERWELYISGVEIANCYTEEIDPGKVKSFIQKNASFSHRIDTELPEIFLSDFPKCSGVALGIDRLLMFFLNQETLQGVNFFHLSDIIR